MLQISAVSGKEGEGRNGTRHESAGHIHPNTAALRWGNAVAVSVVPSSVKLKPHLPVLEQDGSGARLTRSWDSAM